MKRTKRNGARRVGSALIATLLAGSLIGCSSGEPATDGSPNASGDQADAVSIVLDWTPNTNHSGIFVAEKLGYYADAGIELTVLPYSQAGVESVLASGGADFGISGASSVTQAAAQGEDLQMVLNIQQKSSAGIAYRADDSRISRPSDLDGKLFASWGAAETIAGVKQMIVNDGGTGEFDEVTLGTSAYQAVYTGAADFAQGLSTWEGIEAELAGTPVDFFFPGDYGVTVTPAEIGISASRSYLADNQDVARRFVQATQKGYEYAMDHPDEAADILVEANPDATVDPELAGRSQEMLTDYWRDAQGGVGTADVEAWQEFVDYLASSGLLVDAEGKPLATAPQVDDLVTNDYLA
ncbi:ABC transporter substrate-binding protein [Brooklawnia cerclae]|uniref:Thiamine pyrimidine synthase n=1 Tax=Brooklawnia cerclae TaxID=349934 RepID=A0ABX0SEC1_9ACTN|nr:ABC transporter substrate-binding protein [Brooklawnia cerclae]NIH56734.1 ABC-type nitrate/sulfonate/bicarbonate transport system substrate-binding protein [Brooklawnia cerclae]